MNALAQSVADGATCLDIATKIVIRPVSTYVFGCRVEVIMGFIYGPIIYTYIERDIYIGLIIGWFKLRRSPTSTRQLFNVKCVCVFHIFS